MEKRFMQSVAMRIIYKGVFHWFLKLIVGVQFTDCQFLKKEKQFIILANHNSHLDTLSLLSSLPIITATWIPSVCYLLCPVTFYGKSNL